VEGPEKEIVKRIKEARDKDEEVIKAVEKMKKAGVKMLRNEEWQIKKELVLREGKMYVPKDEKLRVSSNQFHCLPLSSMSCYWLIVMKPKKLLVARNYEESKVICRRV